MLKGIPALLSPALLATLAAMGHGDEIVLADANFPGERLNSRVLRYDGVPAVDLLNAILQLFPLDKSAAHAWVMMQPSDARHYDASLETQYRTILQRADASVGEVEKMPRFEFYERATHAFAVVMTGTSQRFGNLILKKGTIFQSIQ